MADVNGIKNRLGAGAPLQPSVWWWCGVHGFRWHPCLTAPWVGYSAQPEEQSIWLLGLKPPGAAREQVTSCSVQWGAADQILGAIQCWSWDCHRWRKCKALLIAAVATKCKWSHPSVSMATRKYSLWGGGISPHLCVCVSSGPRRSFPSRG